MFVLKVERRTVAHYSKIENCHKFIEENVFHSVSIFVEIS